MSSSRLDRSTASAIAEQLRVFAQPLRLTILSSLLDGELSVAAIDAATGIGQPALSQQLAELRRAELVLQRRDAKTVVYRLLDARTEDVVRFVIAAFASDQPLGVAIAKAAAVSPTTLGASAAVFAVVDHD